MGPASSATLLSRASTVAALSRSRGRTMSGASGALKEAQRHIRPKVGHPHYSTPSHGFVPLMRSAGLMCQEPRSGL